MSGRGAGALRRRVVLESPVRIEDAGGGADLVWQQVAVLWAALESRAAGERLDAGRVTSAITHEITFRYRPGVLPEMRFRQGERLFHILAVFEPDDRRRRLRALCEERSL